ncbi:Cof-type HAD-IIB family hydrolase [Selenihalanaerobacter shriftii]|uniref:Uncharacterized protein n=1 Tax=Selenihalanaerobacter shriftii TaxID=142842 RepID=A0A1T4KJ34_9FIRM|nr:Cof-type HAD-IIB family hydrolase [Selenihalanaerobacter shriftii]SJZ42397.1 hypothetical protein SAMN02745118_00800 [Selenihalanaerobacter shriftii]
MKYKLVAIDMDDTLLSDELILPLKVKKVIQEAVDKGIVVTVATGRMYSSTLPYVKDLGLDIPIITYNGALIKEAVSSDVKYHRPVPIDLAKEIVALATEEDWHLNIYLDDILYVNNLGDEADIYERISGIKPVLINEDPVEFLTKPPTKLLIISENAAKTDEILLKLGSRFRDLLNITKSKPRFVEIMNKEISKGTALSDLAMDLGVKQDEVIAIGDSLNDLEMVEYAGLGVAVANASVELKEKADYITKSNEEFGVAEVIKKFIL